MFNNFFFENRAVNENVENKCIAGQATDNNMVHAHCIMDIYGYKHTPRICNIYFSLQHWLHERASVLRYLSILYMKRKFNTLQSATSAFVRC